MDKCQRDIEAEREARWTRWDRNDTLDLMIAGLLLFSSIALFSGGWAMLLLSLGVK